MVNLDKKWIDCDEIFSKFSSKEKCKAVVQLTWPSFKFLSTKCNSSGLFVYFVVFLKVKARQTFLHIGELGKSLEVLLFFPMIMS